MLYTLLPSQDKPLFKSRFLKQSHVNSVISGPTEPIQKNKNKSIITEFEDFVPQMISTIEPEVNHGISIASGQTDVNEELIKAMTDTPFSSTIIKHKK